jgi:hypothetical protein
VIKFNYGDQLRLLQWLGFNSPGAQELGWAFGAGLVGWMLWIAWHVGRGAPRARPDKLARAYIALCKKLGRAGVTRESHQGPLAFASEVSKHRPDLRDDVHSLLLRYAQLRYGRAERDSYAAKVRDFEREVSRLALRARASETPRR